MDRRRLYTPVVWAVIAVGGVIVVWASLSLPVSTLDFRFYLIAALTLGVTSRISIDLPRFKSAISVSDTLIFLTLILYGGPPAILLNAAEGLISSARFCKNRLTVVYNGMALAVTMFLTDSSLRLFFGNDLILSEDFGGSFIPALCLMAFVQYLANSGLVALAASLSGGLHFWQTWHKHFLWTSITYFAGASAAGLVAALMRVAGASALIAATPIVLIVYLTYRTYMKNVDSAAEQAEQARRHVEELSHYISEQERIREQYAQIEKLSALGELASGVAHDFNNTLAGILGRAQLMMRTNDPEKIRRGLEIIVKAAEDGAKTVKRIQDFARQRRTHSLERVAVDQLLLDVSEITRPRWKDRAEAAGVHIRLELHLLSNGVVLGDGSELREVLVNMVFNAVDAMPQGGRLKLTSDEEDGRVVLSVSDTGVGMSEEVRSRVFDPFFTTKGKGGLGLGLAVSYGIISRHEGSIEVESDLGAGTTFSIKLPAAKSRAARVAAAADACDASSTAAAPERVRLLVVDDDESVRELLREILEAEGHEVCVAASGFEALSLFRESRFDAVFTDIGMPGMSGWEFAEAVRKLDRAIPLAVITGWGEAVGSDRQRDAQVDWVVTKPFNTADIVGLAARVANRRRHAPDGVDLALPAPRQNLTSQAVN